MIHTYIPYAPKDKHTNLGWVYNNFMEMVDDDDWVCFLDHDAAFTTRDWYPQLESVIETNPDYGLFTCLTNRIFMSYQKIKGIDENNHDIAYHRPIGLELQEKYNTEIHPLEDKTKLLSGVIILISKKAWKQAGGFADGFLGVDNKIHLDCINNGIRVGLMKGVYVYHWYRGDGDTKHLTEANQLNKNPMK